MLQTPTKQVGYSYISLISKTNDLSVKLVNLPVWRTCHHSSWVLPFKVLMHGCSAAMKGQLCFTQFALHMFRSFVKMLGLAPPCNQAYWSQLTWAKLPSHAQFQQFHSNLPQK